ncbi:MAG: hypothetical protein IPH89_04505 [Bacteroidetes bacterium]|nr:hypothetical protein [Bacteroidota bacterium]
MKNTFIKIGPFLIGSIVLFMLLSLHFGWLDVFFFGAEHAKVQGIDYFAVPKSFLNLLEGRSAFDTWGGQQYGPYSTWYLAHPAFSVFVASWFSFFTPWLSYWLFILFSLLIMVYTAHFISKHTNSQFQKTAIYFVMLCAFPTYWMLYVGNMHAPLVLALAMILIGILNLTYGPNSKGSQPYFVSRFINFFFYKTYCIVNASCFIDGKRNKKNNHKKFVDIFICIHVVFNCSYFKSTKHWLE